MVTQTLVGMLVDWVVFADGTGSHIRDGGRGNSCAGAVQHQPSSAVRSVHTLKGLDMEYTLWITRLRVCILRRAEKMKY